MASAIEITLQPRDLALLRGLFESRLMTAKHISVLYFDGKEEMAKKRLQKLKAAGLVGEDRRKAFQPAVLFLTGKGASLLREKGILLEYPALGSASLDKRARVSGRTIEHELEVMDVKTAFHTAIQQTTKFSVKEFTTWPLLSEFQAYRHQKQEVTVKPDGFIRIHEIEGTDDTFEHTFFLELDRSSETLDTLVARATCYVDYFKSGGFAERNGASRADFKDFYFRVLMVLKNPERRNNVASRLAHNLPPILWQVYLSTFAEVTANPLGDIWIRPFDYREATKGTPYEAPVAAWGYKRDTAREIFVEQNIKKRGLFAED